MYKDLRKKREIDILIDVSQVNETCGGCPTIYDFTDSEGTPYHFRLRHGFARIVCEHNDETLISGVMPGFDGVCGWDDVVSWARSNGVVVK